MKQNIGYRLGTLVRKFKDWQHPKWLKISYVTLVLLGVFQFYFVLYFFALLALVLFIIFSPSRETTVQDVIYDSETSVNNIYNLSGKYYEYRHGHAGYGRYTLDGHFIGSAFDYGISDEKD